MYVYACNNPSESIVAKRRGYGTIVSHNVPPYGRAGRRAVWLTWQCIGTATLPCCDPARTKPSQFPGDGTHSNDMPARCTARN